MTWRRTPHTSVTCCGSILPPRDFYLCIRKQGRLDPLDEPLFRHLYHWTPLWGKLLLTCLLLNSAPWRVASRRVALVPIRSLGLEVVRRYAYLVLALSSHCEAAMKWATVGDSSSSLRWIYARNKLRMLPLFSRKVDIFERIRMRVVQILLMWNILCSLSHKHRCHSMRASLSNIVFTNPGYQLGVSSRCSVWGSLNHLYC